MCNEPLCQITALDGDRCYYHDKVDRGLFDERRRRRTRRMSLDNDQQEVLDALTSRPERVSA